MTIARCFLLTTFLISLTGCSSIIQSTNLKDSASSTDSSHKSTIQSADSSKLKTCDSEPQVVAPLEIVEESAVNNQTVFISSASEEIEHALELCESAQKLWEKGELDKALLELDAAYASILELDGNVDPELNQQKEDLRFMISKRILEIYASRHIIVKGQHNAIPVTLNHHVKKEIKRLTGPEKNFFIRSIQRSGQYRPYIVSELKKAGLPEELSWLPLIESGFNVKALSPARALGLWQFIPSTGYKFGLKRSYYVDERLDPIKSTHAAIAYMTELHKIFGDWSTVLAAYNCGEGRVLRTIRKQKTNYLDNFWDLYTKLPSETARYVPRFLATLHIMDNLEKYNMEIPKTASPLEFETVSVKKQIRLNDIARTLSVQASLLKTLNPELKYALLPPETYQLRIPAGQKELFIASIDKLTPSSYTPPPVKKYSYSYHRVRRGETLSTVAKRYGTSAVALAKANKMSIRSILRIGKRLRVPGSGVVKKSHATTAGIKKSRTIATKPMKYKVKPGDNLWIIAQKYSSTTKAIKSANRLSGSGLLIGQELFIPRSEAAAHPAKRIKKSTYWVKSGDNPFTIAQKYNMTLQRLLALNHLTQKSKIYPGQRLLVE